MGVSEPADSIFEWREVGAQVTAYLGMRNFYSFNQRASYPQRFPNAGYGC
jgi:hypothetical protein